MSDIMEVPKEVKTYCPKCNAHTAHTVTLWSRKPQRGLSVGTRRHNRKIAGYVGKVKGKNIVKKLSKRQVVLLKCKTCSYTVKRILGARSRKKVEVKRS